MKTYPPHPYTTLPADVKKLVDVFDPPFGTESRIENYITAKLNQLDQYVKQYNVSGLIVGISGGVDSAVVYKLLQLYNERKLNSELHIDLVPVFVSEHLSSHSQELAIKVEPNVHIMNWDVEHNRSVIISEMHQLGVHNKGNDLEWAIGQAVSYSRQSKLYTLASIMGASVGLYLVAGTINRDEGSFIGYTCKAGDGMVDIQLISDIGKHRVYELANYLGVDDAIVNTAPRGDMFDGRDDYQVFGTDYYGVRLAQLLVSPIGSLVKHTLYQMLQAMDTTERKAVSAVLENVSQLHNHNGHKYLVGSPAVHLDVLSVQCEGGWNNNIKSNQYVINTYDPFNVNQFSDILSNFILNGSLQSQSVCPITGTISFVADLGTLKQLSYTIQKLMEVTPKYQTDQYGTKVEGGQGSERINFKSNTLAQSLYVMLRSTIDEHYIDQSGQLYTCVGINPYFRVLEYEAGKGGLNPHLDGQYRVEADNIITKHTVLLYLTTPTQGGETELVQSDGEDRSDWSRMAEGSEVVLSIPVVAGNGVIFDGTKWFHQSQPVHKGSDVNKVVLLTELVYQQVDIPRVRNAIIEEVINHIE